MRAAQKDKILDRRFFQREKALCKILLSSKRYTMMTSKDLKIVLSKEANCHMLKTRIAELSL